MKLIDRINNKEVEFFQTQARDGKYLLLSPAAYEELKSEVTESNGDSLEDSFLLNLRSFEGLKIAVLQDISSEDIIIC